MIFSNKTLNINFKYTILFFTLFLSQQLYNFYLLKFNNNKHNHFLKYNDLNIYSTSLSKFSNNYKKNSHCVLLISGFKDTPLVWIKLTKLLDKNKITWFSPRTAGCGRTFYQIVDTEDWKLTYYEAMKVLENLFDEVTIIGFSTGSVIGSTLLNKDIKWKCSIRNFIMINPFFIKQTNLSNFIIGNYYLNYILSLFVQFIPKTITYPFKTVRDTFDCDDLDYYEHIYNVKELFALFNFIKFRPKSINAKRIIIIKSTHDYVIGNIEEQFKIFNDIHNCVTLINCPIKSGHVMLKENDEVIQFLFDSFKMYL